MTLGVELRNVTKSFDEITALDNINIEIHQGEILGLLGANGSGKTTLLKILAIIEKPSKGEVYFDNKRVTEQNASLTRLETTMVFQKTTLFNTTVYNNLAYGLKVRKTPKTKIEEEVNRALRLVKLEGFEKRQAKKLSGGEQQRVALSRALVLNTRLLLLDEPTANLDPRNASIIEEIVSTVNRERKTTIVMATHNMFQAKNLPRRIALIKDGKIAGVGTPAEIFGSLSKTLASFAVVDNVFNGEARTTEDGTTVVDIGNNVRLETTTQERGGVSLFISPKDIILFEERFASSARNVLKGKIVEISDLGAIVRLKVDVGRDFVVQITKRSFNEMSLNLNKEVYIAFKASSVQII
jgi:molybdopterin-binding protein